jgi:hypothetical protein
MMMMVIVIMEKFNKKIGKMEKDEMKKKKENLI